MKFSAASLLLLAGYASAGKPELSFTLTDGSFSDIKSATSPKVTFLGGNGNSGNVKYGGSVDLAENGTPKSIWGSTTTGVGSGWNLKSKIEVSQGVYDFPGDEDSGAYVSIQADNDDKDTFVWAAASISKADVSPLRAGAKKVIEADAGKILISTNHDFRDEETTVVAGFEKDGTQAYLSVVGEKSLLVKHNLNDENSVSIKTGLNGLILASVQNDSDLGSTTVTYTPEEVDVEIKNDGWKAGISSSMPITSGQPNVRFSKSISFQP